MRIFANKSFIFSNGEDEVEIKDHEFKDVPDWVAKTKLFKLAESDGSIQLIEGAKQEKKIEKDGDIKETKKDKKETSTKE